MILPLSIYPREMKIYVHKKTCTEMFIADVFKIVQNCKLPQRPSMRKQINTLWNIHTMEYSVIKIYTVKVNLKIVWSAKETGHKRAHTTCLHFRVVQNRKNESILKNESRLVFAYTWGKMGNRGGNAWRDRNILLVWGDLYNQLSTHQIKPLRSEHFIAY